MSRKTAGNTAALESLRDKLYLRHLAAAGEPKRTYLGCSSLGHSCARKLWYSYYHFSEATPEPRIYRIFDTGKKEELRIIEDLEAAGVTFISKQFSVQYGNGIIKGHLDGLCLIDDVLYVIEIKTHNDRSWKALEEKGVEASKPEHYTQVQTYAYLASLAMGKEVQGLYIGLNKNDDHYYLERIETDPEYAKGMLDRALSVALAAEAPERISKFRSVPPCNYCGFKKICHGLEPAKLSMSCRTCLHRKPSTDGATCGNPASKHFEEKLEKFDELGCSFWNPKLEFLEFYGRAEYDESTGSVIVRGQDGTRVFEPGSTVPRLLED